MKDWKYILYLTIAFGLYLAVRLSEPKQFDWSPSYAADDKNPFGGYVLHELMPALMKGPVPVSRRTLYEMQDSLRPSDNLFILTHGLKLDARDTRALMKFIEAGGHAFLSAQSMYDSLADTLHLDTSDDFLQFQGTAGTDTTFLRFRNASLDSTLQYPFRENEVSRIFQKFDSSRMRVVAVNAQDQPVTLRMAFGKGELILNCTPLIFTNIYTLSEKSLPFITASLSALPSGKTHWMEYYSSGRREASSPLRYILTQEPLAWAYYLSIFSLFLFMIFGARRKQRAIPVIPPLENTSLEFIGTIGNLYHQRGDHRNIADKKILYLHEQLKSRYGLSVQPPHDEYCRTVAGKTGVPFTEVQQLLGLIQSIQTRPSISAQELVELNQRLESFWGSLKPTIYGR